MAHLHRELPQGQRYSRQGHRPPCPSDRLPAALSSKVFIRDRCWTLLFSLQILSRSGGKCKPKPSLSWGALASLERPTRLFHPRLCACGHQGICTSIQGDKSPPPQKPDIVSGSPSRRKANPTHRFLLAQHSVRPRTEVHCSAWIRRGRKCPWVLH